MTPNDFVYWLQGYAELNGDVPTEQQWEVIKDHLQLVMDKKTPVRSSDREIVNILKWEPLSPFWNPPELMKITC